MGRNSNEVTDDADDEGVDKGRALVAGAALEEEEEGEEKDDSIPWRRPWASEITIDGLFLALLVSTVRRSHRAMVPSRPPEASVPCCWPGRKRTVRTFESWNPKQCVVRPVFPSWIYTWLSAMARAYR